MKNKIFSVAAMMLALAGCKDENAANNDKMQAPAVEVVKVEPQNIPLAFEYSARAQGSKETEVRARVGGILLKRNYVEGAAVEEGSVLFEIDPEPFKVALAQAQAKLSQNNANLKAAETQWERVSKLFKDRIVSEKTRDEARASLDSLRASTELAQAEVQAAQLNLDYTTVKAPIGGITSMETQSEGSLVSANDKLTNITQLDPIYVIFSASDSELFKLGAMVEQGMIVNPYNKKDIKAKVKFGNDSFYDKAGHINFVNPTIDETTGTIKLRAVFENPDKRLMPGQFMRLVLEGLIRKNAIVVPQEAVMQSSKGSYVYRVNKEGKVEMVMVEVGLTTTEGEWIIDKGLNPGDGVIISGLMKLRPGMPVTAHIKTIERKTVGELEIQAETGADLPEVATSQNVTNEAGAATPDEEVFEVSDEEVAAPKTAAQ